jgi:octopine/nopaline transport system ATP-binding protein
MAFAREVSSRVVFLHEGLIEEDGAPHEVFSASPSTRFRRFVAGRS